MPNAKIKNKDFWKAKIKESREFMYYSDRLTELSISMFEWKNLPDTIDERFLELTLFSTGMAVFFKDEVMGYLALTCMIGPGLNVYRIPVQRTAYANNGYRKPLNIDDSVIIFNNMLHTNSLNVVEIMSARLAELDQTIDVNTRAQKTPVLVKATETQRVTMLNLYKQFDGNMPVIFGDRELTDQPLTAIRTDAPLVANQLYQLKADYWNEALTYLGISNVNFQKKERMTTNEVERSAGAISASRNSRLNARKQACQQINEMFGLNIDCDYRNEYKEMFDEEEEQMELKEGDILNE